MSIIVSLCSFLASVKTYLQQLNLFKSDSHNESTIQTERRSTRLYFVLLIGSMITLTFYYSISTMREQIIIKYPTFTEYSNMRNQSSLQCICSMIAVKYGEFIQLEPTYHQVCDSDFVSNEWIHHLFIHYEQSWNNSILSDFFRIAVFQFKTLRSLCQLAKETIAHDIQSFQQTSLIQSQLISQGIFENKIDSVVSEFLDMTPKLFLRTLHFIQDIQAQSLLFTGAAVTSIQPKYRSIFITDGSNVPYYGIEYHFSDGSTCTCSSSTATTCIGPATFEQSIVIGFKTGCYMMSALLKSTLEAFYNQTFVNMLHNSSEIFKKLDAPVSNLTIELLLSGMFITHWSNVASFEQYFNSCAPELCQYTVIEHHMFLSIVILLISLFGGLSSILTIMVPIIIKKTGQVNWKSVLRRRRERLCVAPLVKIATDSGIFISLYVLFPDLIISCCLFLSARSQ